MKTVILAGGRGTRIAEETARQPKPMVEIGEQPLLLHLMQLYAGHGFREFVIACGYRGEVIKDYFANFLLRHSDWSIDLAKGTHQIESGFGHDWKVELVDTGLETMTGGRIARLRDRLGGDPFMVTYGDGLSDVDIAALVDFHRSHGKLATVTAVRPPARFGGLAIAEDGSVEDFSEKAQALEGWINGGFLVFEPGALDYLEGDDVPLERAPLERLAKDGQLMAFQHSGFWQPMDTLRDKHVLEDLWSSGSAPWARSAAR